MRRITTHHTNKCNRNTTLETGDAHPESEDGGKVAPDRYTLHYLLAPGPDAEDQYAQSYAESQSIKLQKGPIGPDGQGTNGWTIEALLAVCIDQLECFQRSKFKNANNQGALDSLFDAMQFLANRTRERELRGVEGTHTP